MTVTPPSQMAVVNRAIWRRLARIALGVAVAVAACLAVAAVMLRYEPAFYRPLLVPAVLLVLMLPLL